MRTSALLLLAPVALCAADLQVDHATVCGQDLSAMRARLTAVAINSEPGGPHSNHATEMALTSFPDGSYLELITIQPKGDAKAIAAHEWSKQMKSNSGPCAWALRSEDAAAAVKQIQATGTAVGKLERSGRARPDGVRLEWETAQIGTATRGTFFPFLIHDLTPRDARANPSGHPTTSEFSGISKVVIGVRNLESAIAQYRKAFVLPAPRLQGSASFEAQLAWFEGTPIVLATPSTPSSWLVKRLAETGEGPCAFILKSTSPRPGANVEWFGKPIGWLDESKLGFRLGFE